MPHSAIDHDQVKAPEADSNSEIFKSEDEMRQSLTRLCYGDLYVIGRLWIQALKTILVGGKFSVVSTVHAAQPQPPPAKPPPMKYTDLPLYSSPHNEYKEHEADKQKCAAANVKLLHSYLLPHVKGFRKNTQQNYTEMSTELGEVKDDICNAICDKKAEFKQYMRDPDNLQLRQAVVALGGVTGFYLASRSRSGIPRRLFYTSLGILAGGALCFPKETDEYFRTVAYYTAKFTLVIYNSVCGKELKLSEKMPCKDEMPPPPPKRKPNYCEPKKKK